MTVEHRPFSHERRMQRIDAASGELSFDPVRYARKVHLVFAAVALAAMGCIGAFVLHERPGAALDIVAALPPLGSPAPSTAGAASNVYGETTVEPGRLQGSQSASLTPDLSQQASIEAVPSPPSAAIPQPENVPLPPKRDIARDDDDAPLPPARPAEFGPPAASYDRWTAVYDISAHTVHLPDGTKLEAHSGLGDRLDDPRYVSEPDRGATPPHLYELELREAPFHGVQALRLTPVGDGDIFGRTGLLAHSYMLGSRGDSNGCVSFKNYDAFLRAYQDGQVKRLAVVARVD